MTVKHYQLIKSLGKGGMGEVFLAYDNCCRRYVALKKIREDLLKYKTIRARFLREAHFAAQLTHPSIVPIFSIHKDEGLVYYTMPYVEGKTLKQILKSGSAEESGASIFYLTRVFFSVCQAMGYAHSKGILHRDLKPENIIVGKHGEVLILDWGIAAFLDKQNDEESEEIPASPGLTRPGKVVGTLSYLAPERASGEASSEQTDLYALGVILYQILTLRMPFKRGNLETFQKNMHLEELLDPREAAPFRDIPHQLSELVKKCLAPDKKERFQNVRELVDAIGTYIEGGPQWLLNASLCIENKKDWEFQENILLSKHIAITRAPDVMEWVSLMVSEAPFSGNIKLEASIKIGDKSSGIGFLINLPGESERKQLIDGYCIWIGSSQHRDSKLFRCNVEVLQIPDAYLEPKQWYQIRLENVNNHVRFYINNKLIFHYLSHTLLPGNRIGLLYRDADFEMPKLKVFLGSQNVTVSCMAVPDAFLMSRDFKKALLEYRRIANSFPGRAEEREALYRAGVALLEEGKTKKNQKEKESRFNAALDEFSKLHFPAGAPLEYLGKSLVYKEMQDVDEEIKCLELCVRKYLTHPLFTRLTEHIVYRLHESSTENRIGAYHFALLCLRHIPHIFHQESNAKLLEKLTQNWEDSIYFTTNEIGIQLAFFLSKPHTLLEYIQEKVSVEDALFCLLDLGATKVLQSQEILASFPDIQIGLQGHTRGIRIALQQRPISRRIQIHLFQKALEQNQAEEILPFITGEFTPYKIWALLSLKRVQEAHLLLEKYSSEAKNDPSNILYSLQGCYIYLTQGENLCAAHFSHVIQTAIPKTTALLGLYIKGKIDLKKGWITQALSWEKIQLYRQLILYYTCQSQETKVKMLQKKLQYERQKSLKI